MKGSYIQWLLMMLFTGGVLAASEPASENPLTARGGRFLTLNTVIRVNLTFNSDGSHACELDGTSVTCDQANVTGTVTINTGAALTVSLTGSLAAGQKYFIVTNDGGDAVTGTFAGLLQDAVVGSYGGTDLKISYTGASYTVSNSGGFDTITVSIPQGAAPRKFARVKAIQTP